MSLLLSLVLLGVGEGSRYDVGYVAAIYSQAQADRQPLGRRRQEERMFLCRCVGGAASPISPPPALSGNILLQRTRSGVGSIE